MTAACPGATDSRFTVSSGGRQLRRPVRYKRFEAQRLDARGMRQRYASAWHAVIKPFDSKRYAMLMSRQGHVARRDVTAAVRARFIIRQTS
jgi:hypothetical protein